MAQRTKLLLLIPHLGGGGAEQVTAKLARDLDPNRFEIHLCLITSDGLGATDPPPWVTLHRFRLKRVRHAWLKLIRLIRAEQPHVVLSNMAHLNFLLLAIKPFLPRQTRILIRQNAPASAVAKTWLSRLAYRHLYPLADTILCQSQAMARDLEDAFAIPRHKLKVLVNPIDKLDIATLDTAIATNSRQISSAEADRTSAPSAYPPINDTPTNDPPTNAWPRILTVARLSPEKGIDLLLNALPEIRRRYPSMCLEILGAGPEEASLRKLALALNLEDAVYFRGYIEHPSRHYPNATLFALPSRQEGMPNALLEAAAAGLPLVATPCSEGLSDLLRGAPGTWISATISANSLAETILCALATLPNCLTSPRRFQHDFLTPFESKTAIAAYEALLANPTTQPAFRTAILIPTLDQIGGAERQVLMLAKELSARGHQVTVIALSGNGGSSSLELAVAGVDFVSLEMRKAWVDPRGWSRYLTWAIQAKPDLVHAHLPHATWFARCTRLVVPVRVLVDTIHTSNTGGRARKLAYRITSPLTNQVTCVSQSAASKAITARMASTPSLAILPNGIPLPGPHTSCPQNDAQPSPFVWIAVGRLSPVKDYPTLLRAFAALSDNPRLQIVGSGNDEQSLRNLAGELGIEDRVNFVGFQRDVQSLLSTSDAFVLSSLWEGLPVSALEAAAAVLPVVATDANGTREATVPGKTCFIVPVGDVPALSNSMMQIMSMPPHQRKTMGANGRTFVEEHFAISAVVNRWESLYSDLLTRHPHASRRG